LIAVYQDFHFGILNPSSIHPPARAQPQFRTPGASAPSGSQVCAFGMESAGTFDPFPVRFLRHLAIPLLASPGFCLPVADPMLHQLHLPPEPHVEGGIPMIIGVTHDQDGRVVQRLSVSTKVSIRLPPNGDRNHPTKLDQFVFLRKTKSANRVEWEADPELTRHYAEQCRELHIVLIDDDIANVFPSSYAWWTAIERKCWGDGIAATRHTAEKPGGQPWTTCGSGCPELASGQCKPGGDLRFVLADFPRLGSVCRIHTCSYRSIRQIHSALQEIQTFTGGRLAGITAKLTVRPEEATYFDRKEKRKKTSSIWALSLEVEGDGYTKCGNSSPT